MKQVGRQLEIPFEKTVSKRLETEEERIIKYVIRKFIQENKSF